MHRRAVREIAATPNTFSSKTPPETKASKSNSRMNEMDQIEIPLENLSQPRSAPDPDNTDALFVDSLCPGTSDCAAKYPIGMVLIWQKLGQHWKAEARTLQPGGDYDLVDEFADILGLRGLYSWHPDRPCGPDSAISLQE